MISLIACIGKNREIGFNNDMPWKRGLPADLQYFKEKTTRKKVIMGRKTFESIIKAINKPLPNRENIVLTTRNGEFFQYENVSYIDNLEGILKIAEKNEVFIIGGATIYEQFIDKADYLYLTIIEESFQADTYFPEYTKSDWKLESYVRGEKNEKNNFEYGFYIYKKKKTPS